eukprot:SAG11_NODE_2866_length_2890_cov_4.515944_2_plen_167_part_00
MVSPVRLDNKLQVQRQHTVILRINGQALAVGYNLHGQLGDGTTMSRVAVVAIDSVGFGNQEIAAGSWHTVILAQNGIVFAVGRNNYGQLGDGMTTQKLVPVAMRLVDSDVAHVAAGLAHTVLLKTTGAIKAVGRNDNGQLGDGSTTQRCIAVPLRISSHEGEQITA